MNWLVKSLISVIMAAPSGIRDHVASGRDRLF